MPYTIFVSAQGNPDGDGSLEHPYKDFRFIDWKQIAHCHPSSVEILVARGTYHDELRIDSSCAPVKLTAVRLPGYKGNVFVTIDGQNARKNGIFIDAHNTVEVNGNVNFNGQAAIRVSNFKSNGVLVQSTNDEVTIQSTNNYKVVLEGLHVSTNGGLDNTGAGVRLNGSANVILKESLVCNNPVNVLLNHGNPNAECKLENDLICGFDYTLNRTSQGVHIEPDSQAKLVMDHCIVGPGLNRGIVSESSKTKLSVSNTLLINAAKDQITFWRKPISCELSHVTSYMRGGRNSLGQIQDLLYSSVGLEDSTRIHDSVFYGGRIVPTAISPNVDYSKLHGNNFQYNTTGAPQLISETVGIKQFHPFEEANIHLLDDTPALYQRLLNIDYKLRSDSAPKIHNAGSAVTRIDPTMY